MRLIVTGGGTGGHVYPALEIARAVAEEGAEIGYFGSLRGQEGAACRTRGIFFRGFPSAPLYSLKSARGWKSLIGLMRSSLMAKGELRRYHPDAVFSTGGYSAAPVLWAARSLRIPYVVHEANSVPGRTSLMFAPQAAAFTVVFRKTQQFSKGIKVTRTGQPIRRELRQAAQGGPPSSVPTVLVIGGSQGSEFLNQVVPRAAANLPDVRFIHASGRGNYEKVKAETASLNLGERYRLVPYLETEEMVEAYREATLTVARSGGTLAEFALFRLPSVLVPLPQSADDHQRQNALEFVDMKAASIFEQRRGEVSDAEIASLSSDIESWLVDAERRAQARNALADWDTPNATDQIVRLIKGAAKR